MSVNVANDLAFKIHDNIIDDFQLRAAAYQRLILDDQVGISKVINDTTILQDQQLHNDKNLRKKLEICEAKNKKLEKRSKEENADDDDDDDDDDEEFKDTERPPERILESLVEKAQEAEKAEGIRKEKERIKINAATKIQSIYRKRKALQDLYNGGNGTPVGIDKLKQYVKDAQDLNKPLYAKVKSNIVLVDAVQVNTDNTFILRVRREVSDEEIAEREEVRIAELQEKESEEERNATEKWNKVIDSLEDDVDTDVENDDDVEEEASDSDDYDDAPEYASASLEEASYKYEKGEMVLLMGIDKEKILKGLEEEEEEDDEIYDENMVFLHKHPNFDPPGAKLSEYAPLDSDNRSFVLTYGFEKLEPVEQQSLPTIDYNIALIAQPYRAIAYYTEKQIAIPASEWHWKSQTKTIRVNLCRLQRRWSVSKSPNDKLALMRHAMMSYYTLVDTSPLFAPFKIEEVLEQKPMTDLFNDLGLHSQVTQPTQGRKRSSSRERKRKTTATATAPEIKLMNPLSFEAAGTRLSDLGIVVGKAFIITTATTGLDKIKKRYTVREKIMNQIAWIVEDEEGVEYKLHEVGRLGLVLNKLKNPFDLLDALLQSNSTMSMYESYNEITDIKEANPRKEIPGLKYLMKEDRRTYLKTRRIRKQMGLNINQINQTLEDNYDLPYNDYFEKLNKQVMDLEAEERPATIQKYVGIVRQSKGLNIDGVYVQYLAHQYYDEDAFLIASMENNETIRNIKTKKPKNRPRVNQTLRKQKLPTSERANTVKKRPAEKDVTKKNKKPYPSMMAMTIDLTEDDNKLKQQKKKKKKKKADANDNNNNNNSNKKMVIDLTLEGASGSLSQNSQKIKEFLEEDNQLADLERLGSKKKTSNIVKDVLEKVQDLNVNDWDNLTDYQQQKYVQQVVDNMLYIDGNKGILPYLCNCHSETAMDKWLRAMKGYLRFGYKAARRGDIQTFYGETYSKFFNQTSWESVRRYGKFRKYKMKLNLRGLQIDQKIKDAVVENLESLSAEHDLIALESNVSFANWSSIARFALYEKYNFFLPDIHEQLQGGIFEELMDRKAFDDFVYVYCTLYTLIFNMSGATGATVPEPLTRNERPREGEDEKKED